MAKRFPKETTTVIGELYFSGLDATEITRRLNAGEASLRHPIDISGRSVREKIQQYVSEHGPRPDQTNQDQTLDSFRRRSRQAEARLAREIQYYDQRRPGSLSVQQIQRLEQAQRSMAKIRRETEKTEQQGSKKGQRSQTPSQPERPETVLERMAREQREASTEGPRSTEPGDKPGVGIQQRDSATSTNGQNGAVEPSSEPIRADTTEDTTDIGRVLAAQDIANRERMEEQNGGKSLAETPVDPAQPSTAIAQPNSVASSGA